MANKCKPTILAAVGLVSVLIMGPQSLSGPDASAAGPPLNSPGLSANLTSVSVRPASATVRPSVAAGSVLSVVGRSMALDQLARTDPWELARLGQSRYDREVSDYTCVFLKQERISGELHKVEEIEVRYRERPRSVYMIWRRNADQAKRALFKDVPEFVNSQGHKLALVEPAGALIRLIVPDIMMPIDGKRARESSRRSIDEFGFRETLNLLDHYNQVAAEHGVLDLRYEGEGEIDGRPTYKIVRYLPYDGEGGTWPDAKMVMHLDKEWLLPTAVYSYADREGKKLLGSYVHTKVRLNPGLADDSFRF